MEIKKDIKIVNKPWGREIWIATEQEYAGKILEIKKGYRTSLHYHEQRKETLYVLEGRLEVLDEKGNSIILDKGSSVTIFPGDKHRLVALEDLRLIEVSTPQLDDVCRVEDDYGRTG